MKPVEFLSSAQAILLLQGEPNVRNAISRSYYAVYHESLAAVTRRGLPVYQGSSHLEAAESLKKADLQLGILLRDYHKKRIIADYHLDEDVGVDPQDFIGRCREMMDELDRL
jgi:uncharacterized protein (UPF0332 family)